MGCGTLEEQVDTAHNWPIRGNGIQLFNCRIGTQLFLIERSAVYGAGCQFRVCEAQWVPNVFVVRVTPKDI